MDRIKLASELGAGTKVALYLPRAQPTTPVHAPPNKSLHPEGDGQLLLVVEDDPGVRKLACEMLNRLGYRTLAAEDGRQAFQILSERNDIALMLTDMALPGGMSGADLVAAVRAQQPRLPVLFMTGYSTDAIVNHHSRLHGVRLLAKPFSKSSLACAVLDAFRQPERES